MTDMEFAIFALVSFLIPIPILSSVARGWCGFQARGFPTRPGGSVLYIGRALFRSVRRAARPAFFSAD